jgi:quercetin dioxygenase-like cupin family protein
MDLDRAGSLSQLTEREPFPGVVVRTFESERATVNSYEFAPGAEFPGHSHPQEQITLVGGGEIVFHTPLGGTRLGPGDWKIVGPHVPHRVTAGPTGAKVTALLVPRRGPAPVKMEESADLGS